MDKFVNTETSAMSKYTTVSDFQTFMIKFMLMRLDGVMNVNASYYNDFIDLATEVAKLFPIIELALMLKGDMASVHRQTQSGSVLSLLSGQKQFLLEQKTTDRIQEWTDITNPRSLRTEKILKGLVQDVFYTCTRIKKEIKLLTENFSKSLFGKHSLNHDQKKRIEEELNKECYFIQQFIEDMKAFGIDPFASASNDALWKSVSQSPHLREVLCYNIKTFLYYLLIYKNGFVANNYL